MILWRGDETALAAEDLVELASMMRDVRPSVVIEVGAAGPGLARFLVECVEPGGVVLTAQPGVQGATPDTSGARPSAMAAEAADAGRAFVVLSGYQLGAVFSWAAALRRPDSAIVALGPRSDERAVPDFGRVACVRIPAVESRMPGASVVVRRIEAPEVNMPVPDLHRRPFPRRPLRTVFLGDLAYPSLYRTGVAQGMALLGAWHRAVSIRDTPAVIDRAMLETRPDLIFTHMLLWPPSNGGTGVADLLGMAEQWRRRGAFIAIHDGDPRSGTRFPFDVSASVDLALCNYTRSVAEWRVPAIRWPYGALVQERIGDPVPEFRADLAFAGLLREDGLYGSRTATVRSLVERVGMRVWHPGEAGYNNRLLLADMAPSAIAILGFGRPEVPGWIDTRVYTVPGAGGILIHDDVGGVLEPHVHYAPCVRYDVDSVLAALDSVRHRQPEVRAAAFAHVQAHHTYRQRCKEALEMFYTGVE